MPTDQEYQELIETYDHSSLILLWNSIRSEQDTPGWEEGRAFEYLVLRAFQLEGAEVRWPYRVRLGDEVVEQIDGAVHIDGLSCLLECKDRTNPINGDSIGKLYYILARRPSATLGAIFSRKGFTAPAIALAAFTTPQKVLLWNGEEVDYTLRNHAMCRTLLTKHRFIVEMGIGMYYALEEAVP